MWIIIKINSKTPQPPNGGVRTGIEVFWNERELNHTI